MITVTCNKCGESMTIKAVRLEKRIAELEAENRQLRASLDLFQKSKVSKSDNSIPDVFNDIFKNFNM